MRFKEPNRLLIVNECMDSEGNLVGMRVRLNRRIFSWLSLSKCNVVFNIDEMESLYSSLEEFLTDVDDQELVEKGLKALYGDN